MIKKALFQSMKNRWPLYVLLFFCILLILILEVLPARILEHIVNDYLAATNPVTDALLKMAFIYVTVVVFSGVFDFIKQLLLITLGEEFTMELRKAMAAKLTRIDSLYFSKEDSGVTASRFTSDVDQINSFFSDGIISMAIDALKIVAILVSMFLYSWFLGVLTLLVIPVIFVISVLFKNLMRKAQRKSRIMVGKVNNHISETFKNFRMLEIYDKENYMKEKNREYLEENYHAQANAAIYDSCYSPIIQILTAIVICVLVLTTNVNPAFGLSIGVLAGAIEYITELFSPIESLGMEIFQIQRAVSGIERVREFFAAEEEKKKLNLKKEDILKEDMTLEFKNVSFAYEENKNIITDVSFKAEKNIRLSITGRSGVGKTTMFKLIEGELVPASGEILINGYPASMIPDELKHHIFGYVSQGFHPLKNETILDNITMKNEDITEETVIANLKMTGLYEKISSFEKGIHTTYEEGLFSHGENQLLNIVRAISSGPKILLLDEMTASMDSLTEERIMKALEEAGKGRMILEISHRLSTTMNSDLIIYLKDGKIDSMDTPSEFIKKDWVRKNLLLESQW